MRVDFYQLSRDPAELVVPLLARAAKAEGERVLVVCEDADRASRIDTALWEVAPEAFLAHGQAGQGHEARQPVLIAADIEAANDAKFVILADGKWREEACNFARAFLLFGDDRLEDARACWRLLGSDSHVQKGIERHFWKQDGGKWREMG